MNNVKTINITQNMLKLGKKSTFEKLLPFLLIASYMWLFYYYEIRDLSVNLFNSQVAYFMSLFLGLLFIGVCEYALILIVLWIYKSILSIKPYFYLVNIRTFDCHIKFWIVISNLINGAFCLLLFTYPYLEVFGEVLNIIMGFLTIICAYFSLQKYIEPMFRHMYFKLMVYPWFVYQLISIILSMLFGGI